jgi:hypothetical protein
MKEINAAYEALKHRLQTGPAEQNASSPHQAPDAVAEEAGIPRIFAGESENAKTLVHQHQRFWEYLLTKELLNSRLSAVRQQYGSFDQAASQRTRGTFPGAEYLNWLQSEFQELTSTLQQIRLAVGTELPTAWGKSGEPGDAVQILKVVDEISNCCLSLLRWELEVSAAAPPMGSSLLRDSLRGVGTEILTELERLPDELGRAVDGTQQGGSKVVNINLNLARPAHVIAFLKEMESVRMHPEWLT